MPTVPVFVRDRVISWPERRAGSVAADVPMVELADALATEWPNDHHFCAYSAPLAPKRLNVDAVGRECINMIALVVDVDGPDHAPAQEWRDLEGAKIGALAEERKFYAYETRGGYRIVALLTEPFPITSTEDAQHWKIFYCTWLGYLSRRFGIIGDPACRDWTRCYRLPRVVRDGELQEWPILCNDLRPIQWDPTDADEDELRRLATTSLPFDQALKSLEREPRAAAPADDVNKPIADPTLAESLLTYARLRLEKLPPSVAGEGGDRALWDAVLLLFRGFALPESRAWELLDAFNERCDPPWDQRVLEHKVDDALEADLPAGYLRGEWRAWRWIQARVAARQPLPVVRIDVNEAEVGREVIAALAARGELYDRAGILVTVVSQDPPELAPMASRPPPPRILPMPVSTLRGMITESVRLEKFDKRSLSWEPTHPPEWLPRYVHGLGSWENIRQIVGVMGSPFLRGDGTVCSTPGYDAATRIFYSPTVEPPELPDYPTISDAKAGVAEFADLLDDFPFQKLEHFSAWLASLLTPLARHAFAGPTPLMLYDANTRGSGKSLLAGIAGAVLYGRAMSVTSQTEDEEFRKFVTSIVISGAPTVLIDNVAGTFGGKTLDRLLTTTHWSDRVLGGNQTIDADVLTTWYVTGNNIILKADTARRCLHVRLESPDEQPENRGGFKYPKILEHAIAERRRYLGAALAILRGFCAAGRPDMHLPDWGSYEGWSAVVRGALVWAGLPDPFKTRAELAKHADVEAGGLTQLIEGWQEVARDHGGSCTIKQALDALRAPKTIGKYSTLRGAFEEVISIRGAELPNAHQVGNAFRRYRDRWIGGRRLVSAGRDRRNVELWTVEVDSKIVVDKP